MRLDRYLQEKGHCTSRALAQQWIESGAVTVNAQPARKASQKVSDIDTVEVSPPHPWVSRGGMKLAHALVAFNVDVSGVIAIDVGASTGGFTDVLLQQGAAKIYAVDVGTDQLHEKLRNDKRVVSLENLNARDLSDEHVLELVDYVVCDASFISLTKVLPAALSLAKLGAYCITLIKPQFEAGREAVNSSKAVIKDPAQHEEICRDSAIWFESIGWRVKGITDSPVLGPKGNKEFLILAQKR